MAETTQMTPQYVQPLRLRGSTPGNPLRGTIRKGHKPQHSVNKGLRSLAIDSQAQPHPLMHDTLSPLRSPVVSPSASSINSLYANDLRGSRSSFNATHSMDSIDETWDVVEDLPLRWASDYVSLAISGSRLANTSVIFYDIWSDPSISGRKGALLAVATKATILLYETPKGERAFRFVKVSHLSGTVSAALRRALTLVCTLSLLRKLTIAFFCDGFPHLGILHPRSTSGDAVRVSVDERLHLKKCVRRWGFYTPNEIVTFKTGEPPLPERILGYGEHPVLKPTQFVPVVRKKGWDHSNIRRIRGRCRIE